MRGGKMHGGDIIWSHALPRTFFCPRVRDTPCSGHKNGFAPSCEHEGWSDGGDGDAFPSLLHPESPHLSLGLDAGSWWTESARLDTVSSKSSTDDLSAVRFLTLGPQGGRKNGNFGIVWG